MDSGIRIGSICYESLYENLKLNQVRLPVELRLSLGLHLDALVQYSS